MIALAVALVALAVMVIEPWGTTEETRHATPDDVALRPSPSGTPTPVEEAIAQLGARATADGELSWVAFGMASRAGSTALLDELPEPGDLGSGCRGGALIGEGSEGIALRLPGGRAAALAVQRLFAGRQPLDVGAAITHDRLARVAFMEPRSAAWPPGYYAIALTVGGRERMLPFCVGRLTRAVDYSLIVYVPRGAELPAIPDSRPEERLR